MLNVASESTPRAPAEFAEPPWKNYRTLLCTSPDLNDSVSWWRNWGPFSALREQTPKFNLTAVDFLRAKQVDWVTIENASAVFCNRPFEGKHLQTLRFATSCGRPTWVDFDDLLWEIPRYNPAVDFYGEAQWQASKDCSTIARVVTVSTPFLAEYVMERIAPDADVHVVPNAFPDWYPWNKRARSKTIIYRGGRTHFGDIFAVADDIVAVANEHPDWGFIFCGVDPWQLTQRMNPKQYAIMPMRPLVEFHRWLTMSGASVLIAPLTDSNFNRAKSNISWMEGTLAGAVSICPDFPEFNRPGCVVYKPGEFGHYLREVMHASQETRDECVRRSQEWIDANARLSVVNQKRYELVRALMD